jgi:hypothetical protein
MDSAYTVTADIGTEGKQFDLLVDTASSDLVSLALRTSTCPFYTL